ncbi:hypothetical protein Pcinc_005581 [Petrolisthes cinctipes]|uniref:Uncharacterized protein n=1 Tax=Petrolisthes cinctipes TaxID=88211 RepID=A0AAE1GEL8_PETCI|nr:hypothetical protein Pcinc_005581 [Petrolisthes cinctipes]
MTSTVQLDITHLAAINLTAEDVQAKFVTLKGSFQREPKPGDSCDSPDSVALQYDQPANLQFDDTVPGYACTQHSWVLDQYSQGLTDCHFVLDYEIDFNGMDTSDNARMSYYYEAFKHCESVDCVGMVCSKGGSETIAGNNFLKSVRK